MSDTKKAEELSPTGPSLVGARVTPSTIELDRNLDPRQKPEILVEVKDFTSNVNDVRLRFDQVPVELKFKRVAGSTWRAELGKNELRRLAVGNQTTQYEAMIYARNDAGKIGVAREPVKVSIKAPDLSANAGTG